MKDYEVPERMIKTNYNLQNGSLAVRDMSDKAQEYFFGTDTVAVYEYKAYDEETEQYVKLYAADYGDGLQTNLTFEEVQQDFEELNYDEALSAIGSEDEKNDLQWTVVHSFDDENGNPTRWVTVDESFMIIDKTDRGFEVRDIEISPDCPLETFKSLDEAQTWAADHVKSTKIETEHFTSNLEFTELETLLDSLEETIQSHSDIDAKDSALASEKLTGMNVSQNETVKDYEVPERMIKTNYNLQTLLAHLLGFGYEPEDYLDIMDNINTARKEKEYLADHPEEADEEEASYLDDDIECWEEKLKDMREFWEPGKEPNMDKEVDIIKKWVKDKEDLEELNYDEAIDQVMSQQNCEVDDLEL